VDFGAPSVAWPDACANIWPRCVPVGNGPTDVRDPHPLRLQAVVLTDPSPTGGRKGLQQHFETLRAVGLRARSTLTTVTRATFARNRAKVLLRFEELRKR
jgi:hypothetical protein